MNYFAIELEKPTAWVVNKTALAPYGMALAVETLDSSSMVKKIKVEVDFPFVIGEDSIKIRNPIMSSNQPMDKVYST